MIIESFANSMGAYVLRNMLSETELGKLKNELESLYDSEGKPVPLTKQKFDSLSVLKKTMYFLVKKGVRIPSGLGSNTPVKKEHLQLTQITTLKPGNLRTLLSKTIPRNYLQMEDFSRFLTYSLLLMNKELSKTSQTTCSFCFHKALLKDKSKGTLPSPFSLNQFNSSDYKKDTLRIYFCPFHYLLNYLANYFPFGEGPSYKRRYANLSYVLMVSTENGGVDNRYSLSPTVFLRRGFADIVKLEYVNSKIFNMGKEYVISFLIPGKQSSNDSFISYGAINLISKISRMLDKDVGVVSKFDFLFLDKNPLFRDYSISTASPFVFITEFLEKGDIPASLIHIYLNAYLSAFGQVNLSDKWKKYNLLKKHLDAFFKFLRLFYEVNMMEKKKDVLEMGRKFGWSVSEAVGEDLQSKEQLEKFIRALSGSMQISEKQFLDGILKLQRSYGAYLKITKERGITLDEIAKDPRMRDLFLVGLLNAVHSLRYYSEKKTEKG